MNKMLSLDSRNFHGWGYRRLVVQSLKMLTPDSDEQKKISQEEFEYSKKMIGANLSNFSAWHYRTKLIQQLLNEKSAGEAERRKMLDDGRLYCPNPGLGKDSDTDIYYHRAGSHTPRTM